MYKKFSILVAIIFIIVIIITVSAYFISNRSTVSFVAHIDNVEVPLPEYMVYFREQQINFTQVGGEDIWEITISGESTLSIAKQNALDSLVYIKLMSTDAEKNNITLTKDDVDAYTKEADAYYNGLTENEKNEIPYKYAINAMKEKTLVQKYSMALKTEVTLDEDSDAFKDYYKNYILEFSDSQDYVKVKYILINNDDINLSDKVYDMAMGGTDFDQLIVKYSTTPDANESTLRQLNIPASEKVNILSLKEGDISTPIVSDDNVYILKILTAIPNGELETIKKEIFNNFKSAEENKKLSKIYIDLLNSTTVTKNSEIWDNIELIK